MSDLMTFHPLTPDRWDDFEQLFGPHGAYGGCWCMWWRISRKQFEQQQGEGNRQALKAIVDSNRVPGILGYLDELPVAWCSVAPREEFGSLNRSPVLKPLDDEPVWSIVCLFIDKKYRGQGMVEKIIHAAIDHVAVQGGKILEAYPYVLKSDSAPPTTTFMGFTTVFERAGFTEVARPSDSKRIMRYYINP